MQLFTYGTLRIPEIVHRIIPRSLNSQDATLENYICLYVKDQLFPAIKACKEDKVEGTLYEGINEEEMENLDHYEGDIYFRKNIRVATAENNHVEAWAYVIKEDAEHLLSSKPWTLEEFRSNHLKAYLSSHNMIEHENQ